jgi:hypothetical protein
VRIVCSFPGCKYDASLRCRECKYTFCINHAELKQDDALRFTGILCDECEERLEREALGPQEPEELRRARANVRSESFTLLIALIGGITFLLYLGMKLSQ